MRIGLISRLGAELASSRMRRVAISLTLVVTLLTGWSPMPPANPGAASSPVAGAPAPRGAQRFDDAVASLADALLDKAEPAMADRRGLVIDPLIDRATGAETVATRSIGEGMAARVRERHSHFEVLPFSTASLAAQPLILLGSVAGAKQPGSTEPAAGQPTVYRLWAVLADLRTNRIIARETVWVRVEDIDQTPVPAFRDSPAWTPDPVTAAYIRTCAATAGNPVDPVYLKALLAQALVADAVSAYHGGRYWEALDRYNDALRLPGGKQLRVLNGIYLANWKLGRRSEAETAFARVVDHGLALDRLAVKLLFRPGSAAFLPDSAYPMWLRQIARRTDERGICLAITGHTSVTGSAIMNNRLSLARADRVRERLIAERPRLQDRIQTEGLGSQRPIIGTGADDATDALDRRVEFRPLPCSAL